MIDLLRSASASPPDRDADSSPELEWPVNAKRTGFFGVVGPRGISLPDGRYRLY